MQGFHVVNSSIVEHNFLQRVLVFPLAMNNKNVTLISESHHTQVQIRIFSRFSHRAVEFEQIVTAAAKVTNLFPASDS